MGIVGAGPAGSSAAIRLATAGRNVLLIDRARFPRHKLCGEFVSPECLDHLRDLGVMPDVERSFPQRILKTVFYSSGGRSFSVASHWLAKNGNDSIGLSRQSLDQLLLDRASACGVTVLTETSVVDITRDHVLRLDLRTVDGSIRSMSSSLLIDATGRGRYVARKFDKPTAATKPTQVAFKAHLRGAVIEPGACEIYGYSGGYGGCSHVEEGFYNLCFVVDAQLVRQIGNNTMEVLSATVMQNKRAANVLSHCEIVGDWISVPIARYGSMDPAPAPGIIAIGDAAAFIDPFTGSGIAMALESSRLAALAILNSQERDLIMETYRRLHAEAFSRRLRLCRNLRYLSSSSVAADAMISLLGTSKIMTRFFARGTRSQGVPDPMLRL